jgi:molybdate transport system substrate-binding protein
MKRKFECCVRYATVCLGVLSILRTMPAFAEPLVIAASPSLAVPLKALAQAYEAQRPDINVQLYFDSGLDLRRAIAQMENDLRGRYFVGSGPIHLVAPGGDELIDRLEQKYYVLPGTRRAYLKVPLVLTVPESLADAPSSFESLRENPRLRIAIADPDRTRLGKATKDLLMSLNLIQDLKGRLDVAADSRGVLDHLLSGQADVAIVFGSDAVTERERVRVAAVAPTQGYRPVIHSMAMERYCPNRQLCSDFLSFLQSPEAQSVLKRLGYDIP